MWHKLKVYNEVLDDYVEIKTPIERIVSLDPATTETIFLLALGDKVIATDAFSYRPEEARKKPKIGSYTHVNLDFLRDNKPDIIFTTMGAQKFLTKKLIDEGFTVYPVPVPTSVSKILDNVLLVSLVLGVHDKGRELYSILLSEINKYRRNVDKRVKVYIEFDLGGPITAGFPSHVSDAVYIVGGINIFDDNPNAYFTPSDDEVIRRNPDVVIYEPKRLTDYEKERFLLKLKERGLEALSKKVVFTKGDFLAHQGPSFITEGLSFLYSVLTKIHYRQ